MKFKVGDVVCMSSCGKFVYVNAPANPHNGIGVVSDVVGPFLRYYVRWNCGLKNIYSAEHLDACISPKDISLEDYL